MERTSKELALPPHTYAYTQDLTTGQIKVYTGPTVINQTAQERPVIYRTEEGTFEVCEHIEDARCKNPIAVEGYYLVLFNPAEDGNQAQFSLSGKSAPPLIVGRRINIPGPCNFPLWPGQKAVYVRGHGLRSNQYLIVQIYNEDEARKNWGKAIVKTTGGDDGDDASILVDSVPEDISVGRQFVIKGTEVSFYIPPTGVKVVKDPSTKMYVREALTLERLEYCVLVDEDGSKRLELGPQVVFPKPTERFEKCPSAGATVRTALTLERLEYCVLVDEDGNKRYEKGPKVVFPSIGEAFRGDSKGNKKARAIELNEIQGLHVKVISDYEDGEEHKAGDEIFITGKDTAIYYPREEHVIVRYDGKKKHFATAVPAGEARYVMNRITGAINTVRGPAMLLPDPRTEVFVRRPLTDNQASLWYPGNEEAQTYNRILREISEDAPTTRSGVVSEGDLSRGRKKGRSKQEIRMMAASGSAGAYSSSLMEESFHGDKGGEIAGDEFNRGSTYSQPRSVTLNEKYQGAPTVDVWTGFAIMVISKTGNRRVEVGPKRVILDYDEVLEVVSLSRGTPKTEANVKRTVFLRVSDNGVKDNVTFKTKDHVEVLVKLNYKAEFGGDPEKWFDVNNYVKRITDRARSVLKASFRKVTIAEFDENPEDQIRDIILGTKDDTSQRKGLVFEANGVIVNDVEIFDVEVTSTEISLMIDQAQLDAVKTNMELEDARRGLAHTTDIQTIERAKLVELAKTLKARTEAETDRLANQIAVSLTNLSNKAKELEAQKVNIQLQEVNNTLSHTERMIRERSEKDSQLELAAAHLELEKDKIMSETDAMVKRFGSAQEGFSEAVLALSRNETLVKTAEAMSVQQFVGGKSLTDVIDHVFKGSPLEGVMQTVASGAAALVKPSNGKKPPRPQA